MAVPAAKPPLSEHDYHAWLLEQAARLRTRQSDQIDYEVLAEELEDMGRSERRAVESSLKDLLIHLLKWAKQKQRRSGSWRDSIDNARDALAYLSKTGPVSAPRICQAANHVLNGALLCLRQFPDYPVTIIAWKMHS